MALSLFVFFLCSCCFRRPRQGGSCWWAFPVVHLVQVKGQPEDGSKRKPFLFSWKQPSGPAQGSLLFCPWASSVRESALVSSQGSLGTSCLGSPRAPALVPGRKAQHEQKSGQGATERGALPWEAASVGPQAKRAAFWRTTVRRWVPPPGSPVQPQTSMSSEVASPSPLL